MSDLSYSWQELEDSKGEDSYPITPINNELQVVLHTSGQFNPKFLKPTQIVSIGSKWFSAEKTANLIKEGDDVLIDGVWYLIESVEIV